MDARDIDIEFVALPVWPHGRTGTPRSRWAFRATWGDTLWELKAELAHYRARNVKLAAGFAPGDIRRDGLPRSNARRPIFNGVEISFESERGASPRALRGKQIIQRLGSRTEALRATHPDTRGPDSNYTDADYQSVLEADRSPRLVFATDAYEKWEHNVRAIALTLKALRAVDRYGATQGEQYAGFAALPRGSS